MEKAPVKVWDIVSIVAVILLTLRFSLESLVLKP